MATEVNYKTRRNFGVFLMLVGFIMLIFPIMSSGSMVFRILIGLIALAIIIIGYYTYLRNESYLASTVRAVWPPLLYFQKIGAYCPDYWTFEGITKDANNNEQVVCRNSFGIDVRQPTDNTIKCFDQDAQNQNLNTKTFPKPNFANIYKSVDEFQKDNTAYATEACKFVNNCGPNEENKRATWFGVGTQNGYFKC